MLIRVVFFPSRAGAERSPGGGDHQTVFAGQTERAAARSADGRLRDGGESLHCDGGGGGARERSRIKCESERRPGPSPGGAISPFNPQLKTVCSSFKLNWIFWVKLRFS